MAAKRSGTMSCRDLRRSLPDPQWDGSPHHCEASKSTTLVISIYLAALHESSTTQKHLQVVAAESPRALLGQTF